MVTGQITDRAMHFHGPTIYGAFIFDETFDCGFPGLYFSSQVFKPSDAPSQCQVATRWWLLPRSSSSLHAGPKVSMGAITMSLWRQWLELLCAGHTWSWVNHCAVADYHRLSWSRMTLVTFSLLLANCQAFKLKPQNLQTPVAPGNPIATKSP